MTYVGYTLTDREIAMRNTAGLPLNGRIIQPNAIGLGLGLCRVNDLLSRAVRFTHDVIRQSAAAAWFHGVGLGSIVNYVQVSANTARVE